MRAKTWARAVKRGDFRKLLGGRTDDWHAFVHREASIPGRDRVILRWNFGTVDDASYAWIVYRIRDAAIDRTDLELDAIYVPTDDEPGSGRTAPDELIGASFFAFPEGLTVR